MEILFILTFMAGFLDAMGGGGGLITVPALLAFGISPGSVLGTNKCLSTIGSTAALMRYTRAGLMPEWGPEKWIGLFLGSVFAGMMGAWISSLPQIVSKIRLWIPVGLFIVILFLVRHWYFRKPKGSPQFFSAPLFLIAFYDGLLGPGAGTFFLAHFERHGFSTLYANAVTKVFNIASNIGAFLMFISLGAVVWRVGIPAGICYWFGNLTGSTVVLKKGQKWIRAIVLTTSILLILKLTWSIV